MTLTKPLSEGRHWAEFVLSEANGELSRDTITIVSGAGVIVPGQVLGKVTASGKWTTAPLAASDSDGAQVAKAIALYGCDATSADQKIAAITRNAEVNGHTLTYHTNINDATKRAEKIADLATVNIIVRGDIDATNQPTYPDR